MFKVFCNKLRHLLNEHEKSLVLKLLGKFIKIYLYIIEVQTHINLYFSMPFAAEIDKKSSGSGDNMALTVL